jgi:hypothetical protein
VTGIGCGEQTQLCIDLPSGLNCYPWMQSLRDYPRTPFRDMRQLNESETIAEYMSVFWKNLEFSSGQHSLQHFLQLRLLLPDPLLVKPFILDLDFRRISLITDINPDQQWILELATLFNKAMYWQKVTTLAIVQNTLDYQNNTPFDSGVYSLCDKILFINGDFTNINWIGMWITVGVLLLVCMISYGISLLEWFSRNKVSLLKKDDWQRMGRNISKWVRKCLERMRGSMPHNNGSVQLSTLPARPRPADEEPDDPI